MEGLESAEMVIAQKLESLVQENYSKVGFQLQNEYGLPELDPIRYEICYCILVGCGQAAITLTNHLLENALKTFLVWHDCIHRPETESLDSFMSKASELYNGERLQRTIQLVFEKDLISIDEKNLIDQFRNDYRNAFSHADKKKTFGTGSLGVDFLRLENGTAMIESKEVDVWSFLLIQGLAQAIKAENESPYYFGEIDKIIRSILAKLDQDHKAARGRV